MKRWVLGVAAAAMAVVGHAAEAPYREVKPWGPVPEKAPLEWEPARVAVNGDGSRVYYFRRSDPPIWELDPTGKVLRTFGNGMFVWAHGLRVDPEGNIWAADASTGPGGSTDQLSTVNATAVKAGHGYQVVKFSPDGRVLMTLGRKGVRGDGVATDTFQAPTDVSVGAGGAIFVTDGHGRPEHKPRVLKFRQDATFVKAWGTAGKKPGEFSTAHAPALDSKGRLFVADRGNRRIQIFDQDGKYLEEMSTFGDPSGVVITADDTMYVTDQGKRIVTVGSARDGRVIGTISDVWAEGIAADVKGNLYVGEVFRRQWRKFVRQ
jgi:DNA-binding beta-propeller fold protein YncE